MARFMFHVEVAAESLEQAQQVMAERLDPEEDYGFDYRVAWVFQRPMADHEHLVGGRIDRAPDEDLSIYSEEDIARS